jgi:hypothetical protein
MACSADRFQVWPAGVGPSRLALPSCPALLAWALARFWCPLSVIVVAVGWPAAEARPEPAYSTGTELDLTGGQPRGYVRRNVETGQ